MENEHELSYETLTRVYLGSYEHYKGVGAEVEHSKPGFELQGAKMVETGQNRDFRLRTARVTTPGLRFLVSFASFLSRGGSIARWKLFRGVWVSRLENVQQGGDVASFETKRRFKQVGELLQGV
ncbi:hypothetical protein Tco_1487943 [Tanacetum coccineum]